MWRFLRTFLHFQSGMKMQKCNEVLILCYILLVKCHSAMRSQESHLHARCRIGLHFWLLLHKTRVVVFVFVLCFCSQPAPNTTVQQGTARGEDTLLFYLILPRVRGHVRAHATKSSRCEKCRGCHVQLAAWQLNRGRATDGRRRERRRDREQRERALVVFITGFC